MKPESTENLKFDKRLSRRRGWVGEEDQSAHLEALADVSDKMYSAEEEEAAAAAAEEAAASAEPTPEPPAMTAGFSEIVSTDSGTAETIPEAVPPFDEV